MPAGAAWAHSSVSDLPHLLTQVREIDPMYCPLHRAPILHGRDNGICAACARLGVAVIECELDKIDRVRDTAEQSGFDFDHHQSCAVLVFKNPPPRADGLPTPPPIV